MLLQYMCHKQISTPNWAYIQKFDVYIWGCMSMYVPHMKHVHEKLYPVQSGTDIHQQ